MYFLLDSQENYNNYSEPLNILSLFLSNSHYRLNKTSRYEDAYTAYTDQFSSNNSNNNSNKTTDDFNRAFNSLFVNFIQTLFHIIFCRLTDLFVSIADCFHFDLFLWLDSYFLLDTFKHLFPSGTFEFKIFLVLINSLLVLLILVLILWCILKSKINFYYNYHKGNFEMHTHVIIKYNMIKEN